MNATNTNSLESTDDKIIYSLDTTPWYFGVYLNMAQLNLRTILQDIYMRFNLEDIVDSENKPIYKAPKEDSLKSCFLTRNTFEDEFISGNVNLNAVLASSIRSMPYLRYFFKNISLNNPNDDSDFSFGELATSPATMERLTSLTKELFTLLETLRNNYSHYFTTDTEQGSEPVRNVPLSASGAKCLTQIYDYGCLELLHYNRINQEEYNYLREEHIATITDQDGYLTDRGMVFFINLFLNKEHAFHFSSRVVGFKSTTTNQHLAVRTAFSYFTIRLPKERFLSKNDVDALQLDILSYLQKVPKAVFKHLSPQDKTVYQPMLSNDAKQQVVQNSLSRFDEVEDYESFVDGLTSLDRKSDRFTYYALRLLEECDAFKYAFELSLGRIVSKEYDKNVAGNDLKRRILKEIKVFGKLIDYQSDNQMEKVNNLLMPFGYHNTFTSFNYSPKYNIVANKIGIYPKDALEEGGLNNCKALAYISIHELPKLLFLSYYKSGEFTSTIIEEYINNSKNELNSIQSSQLPLLYVDKPLYIIERKEEFKLTNKEKDYKLEDFEEAIHKVDREKNACKDDRERKKCVQEKQRLQYLLFECKVNARKKALAEMGCILSLYPKKLLYKCLNIISSDGSTPFKEWIKEMRSDCKLRVKQYDSGKIPKSGTMATDLAKDIIYHIIDAQEDATQNKETIKGRFTSIYYNQLQKSLAYYGLPEYKELFIKLCKETNLLDNRNGHPFLELIIPDEIQSVGEFYRAYYYEKGARFEERKTRSGKMRKEPKDWLYQTFYKRVHDEDGKDKTEVTIPTRTMSCGIPHSYYRKYNQKSRGRKPLTEAWFNHKTSESMKLPTTLFDVAIKKIECSGIQNMSISKLLEKMTTNDMQPFYLLDRTYDVAFNKAEKNYQVKITPKTPKDTINAFYTDALKEAKGLKKVEKGAAKLKFKKVIDENEKIVRYQLLQDRILCFCLEKLINKTKEQAFKFKLNELDFSESSPLEQEDDIIISVVNESGISYSICGRRKRKDYAKLKRLAYDYRVINMLHLFADSDKKIPLDPLLEALTKYEYTRLNIFKQLFKLEKAAIQGMTASEYTQLKNGIDSSEMVNIQFRHYTNYLLEKGLISKKELDALEELRNKYSHNTYLGKKGVTSFLQVAGIRKRQGDDIITMIANHFIHKTDDICHLLNTPNHPHT